MMLRRMPGLALAASLALGAAGARAQAQAPSARGGEAGPYANPFTNPYMNPYLNPYLTQGNMGRDATLLYFLAAQRAAGGIGSGALGGAAPAARARPRVTDDEGQDAGSSMVPGGAAAGYFQRGPARRNPSPRHFYRRERYFGSSGR